MKQTLETLDHAGHVAYVVGGSVRDFLIGCGVKDHDIATSANPEELCRLFPRAITVGKAFGVIKVPIESDLTVEVATFREDLDYVDYRHPRAVRFGGPVEDARRRDFTVNALFYDPKTSRVLDSVGGMEDLKARLIRAIGDPSARFKEDALRLLRAVRFSAALGLEIEAETAAALRARAKLVAKVSPERVRDELTLMWTGPRPGLALRLLLEHNLLGHVLPEVDALPRDVRAHTVKVLDQLAQRAPKRSAALGWAAVLHEIGKPLALKRSGGQNANGHEIDGARLAAQVAARLRMARSQVDRISQMVGEHLKFKDVFQMREATLQRFLRQDDFDELLELHRADAIAADGNLAYYEFCAGRRAQIQAEASQDTPKLLDGTDLIQLGLAPGPGFAEILRVIEDLALERRLNTKEEALEYVVRHFVR